VTSNDGVEEPRGCPVAALTTAVMLSRGGSKDRVDLFPRAIPVALWSCRRMELSAFG
jgi:hypothetical protein